MKILIGCEESQTVTSAFRRNGQTAFSNDLKPCSGGHPEWHLRMCVIEAIKSRKWDFIGLHPDCTAMTLSGNRTYATGKQKHRERLESIDWTLKLWEMACDNCDHVYMENPMGAMNGDMRLPKPQIIQPYYFGDEYQKTTCLWIKGLPHLFHNAQITLFDDHITHVSRGEMVTFKSGCVMPKWYADAKALPEFQRKELRSKTFPGIANAMADQWTKYLNS
jgi:hypothetical protein